MCELLGVDFDQIDKLNQAQLVTAWMYAAYLSHQSYRRKKARYSFLYIERVYYHYYVYDHKTLQMLVDAMMKSKVMGRSVEKWAGAEKKK